jgi:hypothetical protein
VGKVFIDLGLNLIVQKAACISVQNPVRQCGEIRSFLGRSIKILKQGDIPTDQYSIVRKFLKSANFVGRSIKELLQFIMSTKIEIIIFFQTSHGFVIIATI